MIQLYDTIKVVGTCDHVLKSASTHDLHKKTTSILRPSEGGCSRQPGSATVNTGYTQLAHRNLPLTLLWYPKGRPGISPHWQLGKSPCKHIKALGTRSLHQLKKATPDAGHHALRWIALDFAHFSVKSQ